MLTNVIKCIVNKCYIFFANINKCLHILTNLRKYFQMLTNFNILSPKKIKVKKSFILKKCGPKNNYFKTFLGP